MRILAYTADERRFTYTLEMSPTPGVEPVEDFLFNRRQGHCEYFATAMAVLLREVGVPDSVRAQHARWIAPTGDVRLTLVTCWPVRPPGNTHRVIVVARP